jgi:CRISPR/Cas system-associated endoribonuclease Cas2
MGFIRMRRKVEKLIDKEGDKVLIIRLPDEAGGSIIRLGNQRGIGEEDVIIF